MPYICPVEGGEPIRIVGRNVQLPGWTTDEAWVAGLSDSQREELGFVWAEASADEYAAQLAVVIAGVKAEANARINTRYPAHQQANMNMRATELVDLRLDGELTAEEDAERLALKAAAAWIRSVRGASDQIEADLPNSVAELVALDIGSHPAWPD